LDLFPKTGFAYDADARTVVVPEAMVVKGYDSVGSVLDATEKEPEQVDFNALPDPYLVFSHTTDFLAVTDRAVIGSVLFRLLGLFDYDTRYFEPVCFDFRSGGVWLVR
jgi:undecaprenyl-diphosphooligosaccharide--protein glycosyltransferase